MSGTIDHNGSLHAVPGFQYAGLDLVSPHKGGLGLVYAEDEKTLGTAKYTRNDVKAAPVLVSMQHDRACATKRAVLINSGAANAFTGRQGLRDAEACAEALARSTNIRAEEVYIGSTGAIGTPLPLNGILARIGDLTARRGYDESSARSFAKAIMTTDTRPKQASVRYDHNGSISIASALKGAGMIMPNMATMLCVVVTDAAISLEMMNAALGRAVEDTFHHATIDGDTSTNDTVFLLANGRAGNGMIREQDAAFHAFTANLTGLLEHMTKAMVRDGEGMTKFITIRVAGVPNREVGKTIAFSIANSPLVKTALFGEQMNWGRLMMAAGKAGTGLDFGNVDLTINGVSLLARSELVSAEALSAAATSLKSPEIFIDLDINEGDAEFTAWTCDYSIDYIKINAKYLT